MALLIQGIFQLSVLSPFWNRLCANYTYWKFRLLKKYLDYLIFFLRYIYKNKRSIIYFSILFRYTEKCKLFFSE